MARAVRGYDPDAPDAAAGSWDVDSGEVSDGVWLDPFDDVHDQDSWVEPFDEPALDTPAARADWAYGRAVDPMTSTEVLRQVATDLAQWDIEALLAEAAIDNDIDAAGDLPPSERPDAVVLRSLLRHPNLPDDLPSLLVGTWLQDPAERSVWAALVGLAHGGTLEDDLLVTALTEACDAARTDPPPPWSLLVTALAAARPGGAAALDLLAIAPFPHHDPTRLWPDAEQLVKGLPGGTRARANAGAEALGWDGVRHEGLVDAVVTEVHRLDTQARRASLADELTLCPHGPVVVTAGAVSLPAGTRGEKPYVARIVGSHPVFKLKRDWPDRNDGRDGTAWTWTGGQVLEARGLGCDGCRDEPDNDKRYFVSTGDQVAPLRLRTLRRVLDTLDSR